MAVLLLLGCVIAMFWRAIFTPAMFFYRDVFNYSFPHAKFIHEICRQGYLPYWNPFLNFGEPVLANPNFLFFYPSTLLLVLLPVGFAYTMHYVAHFAVAGVGAYWLSRRWGQSRVAGFLAAFIFAFSGPVLSLGNFYNHIAAAAWIPWALLLADSATESRSWRPWILLTLVFTLQFLAAEPFTLIATFGLALAYVLYRSGNLRQPLGAANGRIVGKFLLVGCLMVGLSAVQFLPSLDLLANSRRGVEGLPFNETTSWSFHPLSLMEVVIPEFFGVPLEAPSLWTLVLSCRNMPYFPSVFVGFVPVFLALCGWVLSREPRRKFVAAAGAILLVLSFGRFTPVFAVAYLAVPPLALVRFPVKLLVPACLMVSLLAGWGFDALRKDAEAVSSRPRRILLPLKYLLGATVVLWLVGLVAPSWIATPAAWTLLRTNAMFVRSPAGELTDAQVAEGMRFLVAMVRVHLPGLAGFTLAALLLVQGLERGKAWARRAIPVVGLVGVVQLVLVNYRTNPTVPRAFYTHCPPVLAHFEDSVQPYRFSYIFREANIPPGTPDIQGFLNLESIPEAAEFSPLAQVAFRDRLVLARGSMLEKVEGISNIDVERSFPPSLYDFWVYALRKIQDPARLDCLLGRTNVRYQILPARHPTACKREIAPIFNGSPQPSYLCENLCVSPRAYFATTAVYSGDASETLARMSSPEFDAINDVILAAPPKPATTSTSPDGQGRVDIVERKPNSVTLRTESSRAGYAVLLDRFDPNWRASVDGENASVHRANHLFRAVLVPAGVHEVLFYYRQRGLRAGGLISLAVLAGLVLLYLLDPPWRRLE